MLNPLKWDPIASANYQGLKRRLSPFRKEQLDERIDVLREWPPAKWFELRDREDGTITFQMETDQFAMILGRFEDGTVYLTHFELRSKVRE